MPPVTIGPDIASWPRRFSVLGPLMGGFGSQAFLGCDHGSGGDGPRPAVMVFLPDEIVEDRDLFEAILQETEVAAHIDHQNVMGVIGLARIDEGYARIVEYGDAESLMAVAERLRVAGEKTPTAIAVTIVSGACAGVHYAHELGRAEIGSPLIHAAIRPSTLLISYRGHAKVSGYGAAVLAEGLRQSRGEQQARSDPYTAPEQVLGGRNAATAQTDVYSLGAVLYEMLVGQPPPPSDWPNFDRQVEDELKSEAMAERVPDGLRAVVMRAMRRRAVERFQTVLEMRHALLELELAASEAELRAFMENLFGANFPSRLARRKLLENVPNAMPVPSLMLSPRPGLQENDSIPPRASLDEFDAATSSFGLRILDDDGNPLASPIDESAVAPPPALPFEVPAEARAAPAKSAASSAAKAAAQPAAAKPPPSRAAAPTTPPGPAAAPPATQPPYPTQPPYQTQPPYPPSSPGAVVYRTHPAMYAVFGLFGGVAIVAAVLFFTNEGAPPPPPLPPVAAVPAPPPPPPPPEPTEEPAEATEDKRATQRASKPQRKQQPTGPGKIAVSTSPDMDIYVDGKKIGNGSATTEVKAGSHVVKGRNGALNVSVVKKVKVSPGKTANVTLRANKGGLVIDAPAGSVVFINGKKAGSVPGLDVIDLYEGRHKVLVKNGSAQYRHTVPIRAGLDTTLTVNFHER